jgi:hypothetical protein
LVESPGSYRGGRGGRVGCGSNRLNRRDDDHLGAVDAHVSPSLPGKRTNNGQLAHLQPEDGHSIIIDGKLAKIPCVALPDTGETHSVVDAAFIERAGLSGHVLQAPSPLQLHVAGNTEVTLTHAIATTIQIGNMRSHIVKYVMPSLLQDVDLIIGMNWMKPHSALIHTAENAISVTVEGKQHYLHGKSLHNIGVAALQQCFHNPHFMSAKQAALALKRGYRSHLFVVQHDPTYKSIATTEQPQLEKLVTEHGEAFDTALHDSMCKVHEICTSFHTPMQ